MQNHQPETEGDWGKRKLRALQGGLQHVAGQDSAYSFASITLLTRVPASFPNAVYYEQMPIRQANADNKQQVCGFTLCVPCLSSFTKHHLWLRHQCLRLSCACCADLPQLRDRQVDQADHAGHPPPWRQSMCEPLAPSPPSRHPYAEPCRACTCRSSGA